MSETEGTGGGASPPPGSGPSGGVEPSDRPDLKAYWRANLVWLSILLSIWALVSYVCGIILVEPLNRISLGGAPLGFWFAQQGSIYVFVLLIAVYVVVMNRLDRRYGVREQ